MKVSFEMRKDGTFTETIEEPKVTSSGNYRVDGDSSVHKAGKLLY